MLWVLILFKVKAFNYLLDVLKLFKTINKHIQQSDISNCKIKKLIQTNKNKWKNKVKADYKKKIININC